MSDLTQRIQDSIRDIPDFPIEGIIFKDITPVLSDIALFSDIIDDMARRFEGEKIDAVVGMESRGFLFGAPLAMKLGAAFVPLQFSDAVHRPRSAVIPNSVTCGSQHTLKGC